MVAAGGKAAADIIVPAVVAVGSYVIHKASEHTKNKRKSTYDKHTKPLLVESLKRKEKKQIGNLENSLNCRK